MACIIDQFSQSCLLEQQHLLEHLKDDLLKACPQSKAVSWLRGWGKCGTRPGCNSSLTPFRIAKRTSGTPWMSFSSTRQYTPRRKSQPARPQGLSKSSSDGSWASKPTNLSVQSEMFGARDMPSLMIMRASSFEAPTAPSSGFFPNNLFLLSATLRSMWRSHSLNQKCQKAAGVLVSNNT